MAAGAGPGAGPGGRVPAAAFFQDPAYANARMSPDGRQVVMTAAGEKGVRTGLVVVDLETMTPRVIALSECGRGDTVLAQ
ncbi:hypothetical protein LP419_14885 [Massilia sp. H-1]|nr:hypothetical protein LP419_14885 [Massilia sp. H-1]